MNNKVIELKKTLLANIAVINFLEHQLQTAKDKKNETVESLCNALVDEVNANLAKIHPQFGDYLSRTIANFRSLNECYYYKNTQDTDTVTIKNYLLKILEFGSSNRRTFITLPAWGLPKKAFTVFFKNLGVTVEKSKNLSIYIQEIKRVKGDRTKYVCFHLNFRNI
jgi:hypothetical protein